MTKLLPQANNLDTVVDAFMYIYLHPTCSKEELSEYCGFTLRQVDYYTNACKYLDLINDDWSPTPLAKDIFTNNPAEVTERVYARIISDDVFSKIYAMEYLLPNENHSEFAKNWVKECFPGYSEAVYERRSNNIIKWCQKIINYVNNK